MKSSAAVPLLAEMHAEIAQLRAELESTRAVAARLAGLLRSRNQSATLVPVRRSDAPVTAQPGRGAGPDGSRAEALGRTAQLRETNDGI